MLLEKPVMNACMFINRLSLLLLCVALGAFPATGVAEPITLDGATTEVCFSPNGGCTDAIVHEIESAKIGIMVQAYSFTSAPIAEALAKAHARGLMVVAILDKSQRSEKYSSADFLTHAGIKTYIDDKHAIAHNKIMIIDGQTIITGSFNFTKAAEEKNAENLLIIKGARELSLKYQENFNRHVQHSVEYGGR